MVLGILLNKIQPKALFEPYNPCKNHQEQTLHCNNQVIFFMIFLVMVALKEQNTLTVGTWCFDPLIPFMSSNHSSACAVERLSRFSHAH